MRPTIRLLTLATLSLFVVALWVADQGERAVATTTAQHYPGVGEFFMLWALLALALLLFLFLSVIGIALAHRQRDQIWGTVIAFIVIVISALYLGSLVPPGVLLPVVRRVLPSSTFQAMPLTLLPVLLGSVVMAAYSFHTPPALRPQPHRR